MKLYKVTMDRELYFNNKQSALDALNALLQTLPFVLKTALVDKVGEKDKDDYRGYDTFVTGYEPMNVSIIETTVDFVNDEEVEKIRVKRERANAKLDKKL